MSTIKLYTEEQLHNTVIAISNYLDDINIERAQQNIEKHLKALIPIELPSDEEIDKVSFDTYRDCPNNPNEHPEWEYNKDINAPRKRRAFNKGAKWMKNKIQGGNK